MPITEERLRQTFSEGGAQEILEYAYEEFARCMTLKEL